MNLRCILFSPHLLILKGLNKKISITTNGSLLETYPPDIILSWNIDLLNISIDGYDEKSYIAHRPEGNYANLRNNLKMLYNARKRYGLKFPLIRIANVLFPDIIHEDKINEFKKNWIQYADMIAFTALFPLEKKKYTNLIQCSDSFFIINIRWSGSVPICGYNLNKWIGNVSNSTILNLFNSDERKKLQDFHLKIYFDNIPFCMERFYGQEKDNISLFHSNSIHKTIYLL